MNKLLNAFMKDDVTCTLIPDGKGKYLIIKVIDTLDQPEMTTKAIKILKNLDFEEVPMLYPRFGEKHFTNFENTIDIYLN